MTEATIVYQQIVANAYGGTDKITMCIVRLWADAFEPKLKKATKLAAKEWKEFGSGDPFMMFLRYWAALDGSDPPKLCSTLRPTEFSEMMYEITFEDCRNSKNADYAFVWDTLKDKFKFTTLHEAEIDHMYQFGMCKCGAPLEDTGDKRCAKCGERKRYR